MICPRRIFYVDFLWRGHSFSLFVLPIILNKQFVDRDIVFVSFFFFFLFFFIVYCITFFNIIFFI